MKINKYLTLGLLIIVSIVIIIFFVFKSNWIYEWIDKTKREAELQAEKAKIARSKAYDVARAEAMEKK